MREETNMELTRRDFLRGSATLGIGALGAYALGGCAPDDEKPTTGTDETPATETPDASEAAGPQKVTLHRGYFSAHTTRAFAQAVVALDEGGKIVACDVEDYQFMDPSAYTWIPVPNSDAGLGEGYGSGMVLISKKDNSEVLSAWAAREAGSAQSWIASMTAIEAFTIGKAPNELTSATLDDVSGATLVDTDKYLKGIAAVAADNSLTSEGVFEGDASELTIGSIDAVCHGPFSFGNVVSVVQNGTFVGVSIDEFQFLDSTLAGLVPVPNSDALFGGYYAEGQALMSKSINSKLYSEYQEGATQEWLESIKAIEEALVGQKVSSVSSDAPDSISGATLMDTASYVKAAVAAAESAD